MLQNGYFGLRAAIFPKKVTDDYTDLEETTRKSFVTVYTKTRPSLGIYGFQEHTDIELFINKGGLYNSKKHLVSVQMKCTGKLEVYQTSYYSPFTLDKDTSLRFAFRLQLSKHKQLQQVFQARKVFTIETQQLLNKALGHFHFTINLIDRQSSAILHSTTLEHEVNRAVTLFFQVVKASWGDRIGVIYYDGKYPIRTNPWSMYIPNNPDLLVMEIIRAGIGSRVL